MLVSLGIIDSPIAWTARPETAMIAMIAVDVWKTTPFMALMILAGLQMLPQDCYEQAKVDGIHPVRVFFEVTLPLLRPAIIVAVVFRALDTLRVFDLFYIMTTGTRDMMSMSMYARFPDGRQRKPRLRVGHRDDDLLHNRRCGHSLYLPN